MDRQRAFAVLSILAAAISLTVGVRGQEGAMIALSCFAVLFSSLSFLRCSAEVYVYSLAMSLIVLVCTAAVVTATPYESLFEQTRPTEYAWTYIIAAIKGAAAVPLIMMFFFIAAAFFNASYNWVLVSAFSWMVGMGLQVPAFLTTYVVQHGHIVESTTYNLTLVLTMLVELVIFVAMTVVLRHIFKKNHYLITAKGLVTRQ